MQRGFNYLIDMHGEAGARDIFEKICIQVFQQLYGEDAKAVRISQGDGGIDILVGDLPTPQKIYQCKFFPIKIGSSQKMQIKESFETAIRNYSPKEWILCLPLVLSKEELLWWSQWKSENENDNLCISFCDGSYLINLLKKFGFYSEIFDDDIRETLQIILDYMSDYKKDVINEIIYGYDDENNIVSNYQDNIFVKMLESANITNTKASIIEFYNAEIAKYTVLSKDEIEGLKAYNNSLNSTKEYLKY
ncbi:hypothetical protein M2475_001945 [Breznakia sp. PF5-3]|uniref:hypothetical protein n=1 Tax=unclassified Breznakia TaxID=2623764 RepID=UPI002406C05A|nr:MULTISPECIES: hypothetical protein [unclassified Breznakia]MDF9825480.1 hypothetical protein [Breznakia sp. PM6-1]MDF9836365.1 hypothetical protein [Breznakia sp. PF5-3]MDF9838929.1 hypothetical protein [Breznakia sp. PFB2-8]MDF9860963.1 hypothetical protein [Breznakia sp. PH5-24]